MKKTVITFLISAALTGIVSADQLGYITKEQAEKAAALLKSEREIMLFCGCCDNDPKIYLKVADVKVKHTGYQEYYQVIVTGITRTGEKMTVETDLAYVHVNRNGMAVAAGTVLGFKCDPCVYEMNWKGETESQDSDCPE